MTSPPPWRLKSEGQRILTPIAHKQCQSGYNKFTFYRNLYVNITSSSVIAQYSSCKADHNLLASQLKEACIKTFIRYLPFNFLHFRGKPLFAYDRWVMLIFLLSCAIPAVTVCHLSFYKSSMVLFLNWHFDTEPPFKRSCKKCFIAFLFLYRLFVQWCVHLYLWRYSYCGVHIFQDLLIIFNFEEE